MPQQDLALQDGWVNRIWQDLQPTSGRLSSTLLITLASVLTLLVLMTFQMPFASLGLYFVFLVGRDSPAVSQLASPVGSDRSRLIPAPE